MTEYVIAPPAQRSLGIVGSPKRFPINRIICVGRNYAAHAREMGMDPSRIPPFFFMKPATALVEANESGVTIPYPSMTANFHHEIELVVAIHKGGANIAVGEAWNHIFGYAVGLDMTRRDLQLDACSKKQPWEFGKAFSFSAPIGPLHTMEKMGRLTSAAISLQVNGQVRQSSNIDQLTWNVPEIIAELTRYEALQPGDLIMTGTPEGVSAVVAGDVMLGELEGLGRIKVTVV